MQDIFKYAVTIILVGFWIYSIIRKSNKLIGVTLFFTGFAAFSQNFLFYFREINQLIQIFLIVSWIAVVIKTQKVERSSYVFAFLGFFILVSFLSNPVDEDAQIQLINFISIIGITGYLYSQLITISKMQELMKFIAQLATIESIAGLFEYFLGISSRIEGTFSNPNYFGLFVGVGWCLAYQTYFNINRFFVLSAIFLALVLSGSRVAIVFPVFQILWNTYRNKGFSRLLIVGGVVGIVLSVAFSSGIGRFSNIEEIEGSDAERAIFASIALRMATDNPLTGVGWGRFPAEFANYSSTEEKMVLLTGEIDVSSQERRVTHNDYLRILAELGWVAFVLTLFSLFYCLRKMIGNKQSAMDFVFPVWMGIVLFSATHNNLNSALFWLFFLMPFSILYNTEFEKVRR